MYYAMLENGLLALLLAPHLPELWYFRFELNPDCVPIPVLCISTLFPSILQRASPMQYIKDQKLSFSFPLSWTRRYLQYGVSPAEALTFFGFLHSCSRVFLWSGRLGHTIGLILKAENIHKLNKWQREKVHKYIVLFVWGDCMNSFLVLALLL